MIETKRIRGKKLVSATFRFTPELEADHIDLVGDFNDWSPGKHQMRQRKDGCWSVTLRLKKNKRYQFRYLVDGQTWLTDAESDTLPNEYGSTNALLQT